jgi:hypothetical protein
MKVVNFAVRCGQRAIRLKQYVQTMKIYIYLAIDSGMEKKTAMLQRTGLHWLLPG